MFLPALLFVCLSVNRITKKSFEPIWTKPGIVVGLEPITSRLDFGDDPNH